MNQRNISKSTMNIVTVGLFAAICYVAVMLFRIPYPAPVGSPFLHFGNLFVILCALLFGGWQGGLAGSIGMGLYDIMSGYGWATSKTIILKFGIGLFTGLVMYYGMKRPERPVRTPLLIASGISLLGGAFLLYAKYHIGGFEDMAPLAYIFLFVLFAVTLVTALLTQKLRDDVQLATLAACAGIAFNVVGEFVGGTVMKLIAGSNISAAMVASVLSLPATLINGVFSIIGAVLLYVPLKKALHKIGFE